MKLIKNYNYATQGLSFYFDYTFRIHLFEIMNNVQ